MILKNKKPIWIVLILVILFSLSYKDAGIVQAFSEDTEVNIYIFWGEGCPHCAEAKPVLEEIAALDARIGFYDFEVYDHPENLDLFLEFSDAYGVSPQGVPTMFIGEQYWIGYSENIRSEMASYINYCLENGCGDPGRPLLISTAPATPEPSPEIQGSPTQNDASAVSPTPLPGSDVNEGGSSSDDQAGDTITLPLIGTVDLSDQSILFSTLIISIVDGFNHC